MDIEIALKFEAKKKFVLRELQFEENYESKKGNPTPSKGQDRGRSNFDPLKIQHNHDPIQGLLEIIALVKSRM